MVSKTSRNNLGFSDSFEERFNKNFTVDPKTNCWNWLAAKNTSGYGIISTDGTRRGQIGSHRAIWMFKFGKIPSGECVLHTCDNRACVNPNHLFLGSIQDNVSDMISKGRQKILTRAVIDGDIATKIRKENSAFRKQLSEKYGIHITQICRIINRRRWNHNHNS